MSQLWCATSPVKILVDIAGWIGNNDVVDSALRSWWFLFLFQKDPSQVSMASLNTVRFSVDQCRSLYEIQTFRTFGTAVFSLLIFIAPCEVTCMLHGWKYFACMVSCSSSGSSMFYHFRIDIARTIQNASLGISCSSGGQDLVKRRSSERWSCKTKKHRLDTAAVRPSRAVMSFTTSDVSKLHGWLSFNRRNGGEKDTVSDHWWLMVEEIWLDNV